jgi:cytochrome c oxidase subunit 2
MLFTVKVVSQADFDAHIADLKAKGQVGALGTNLGRQTTPPDGGYKPGRTATPEGTATN